MVVLRAKCVFIGDAGVGKTSIEQFFNSDGAHFPKTYGITTSVELNVKAVNIPDSEDVVELFLFDCPGNSTFNDLADEALAGATFVVIVYDVSKADSFEHCRAWCERMRAHAGPSVLGGVLIGNKLDLAQRREVTEEQVQQLASDYDLDTFECSAKAGRDVETPFHFMAGMLHAAYQEKVKSFQATAE
eukprot:m.71546 g.71546  ORF g.71546 m.71546 type:complete len:188 (+) comp12300_c0_seq1:229-792(+)